MAWAMLPPPTKPIRGSTSAALHAARKAARAPDGEPCTLWHDEAWVQEPSSKGHLGVHPAGLLGDVAGESFRQHGKTRRPYSVQSQNNCGGSAYSVQSERRYLPPQDVLCQR